MITSTSEHAPFLAPHTYFKNALILFENGEVEAALQTMDAAIVFSNNSPFYIYQKVKLLYHLGALKSCTQLIVSQLEYLYKYSSLYILCRVINYLQLINHYTKPQLEKLLHSHHVPYCLAQHYHEWLTLKHKPFFKLAQKAMFQDNYRLCLDYCQIYLKCYPPTIQLLEMQAYTYHILGDLASAEQIYQKCLHLDATSTTIYEQLVMIYMELGQYEAAIAQLKYLLNLEPTHKDYLSYLGECYTLSKQPKLALQTYKTINKYYPDDIQNYFNLSHIYRKTNKKWHAHRCLKHVKKHLKQQVYH